MRLISALLLIVCVLALAGTPGWGQEKADRQARFQARLFTDEAGKTLPYRLLVPKDYDAKRKYPLLLFLHGASARGNDNKAQLATSVAMFAFDSLMEKYPCFVVAPQCPEDADWVETDKDPAVHAFPAEPSEPMRLTLLLLDALRQEFNIDKSRLYVTGFSMGGFGVWDIIARRPDLFAAAVPVCGGGDEAAARKIRRVAIWAFHGDSDTTVSPERSRSMIAALQEAGAKPRYTEFLNVGHDAWNFAYASSDLYEWLFGQKKK